MVTVKELIEKLKEYPEDMVVSVVYGYGGPDITDTFSAQVIDVLLNHSVGIDGKGEHAPVDAWWVDLDSVVEERLLIGRGENDDV